MLRAARKVVAGRQLDQETPKNVQDLNSISRIRHRFSQTMACQQEGKTPRR